MPPLPQIYHSVLMAVLMLPLLWALYTFLSPYVAGNYAAQSADPGNCSAASFAAVLPTNAVIERVDYVADGAAYGEGEHHEYIKLWVSLKQD